MATALEESNEDDHGEEGDDDDGDGDPQPVLAGLVRKLADLVGVLAQLAVLRVRGDVRLLEKLRRFMEKNRLGKSAVTEKLPTSVSFRTISLLTVMLCLRLRVSSIISLVTFSWSSLWYLTMSSKFFPECSLTADCCCLLPSESSPF